MSSITLGWIVGLLGFATFWSLHIFWFMLQRLEARSRKLMLLALIMIPMIANSAYLLSIVFLANPIRPSLLEQVSAALLVFTGLYFIAMAFYAMTEHAVRVRLLVELYQAGGTPVLIQDIMQRYSQRDATLRRLEQLERGSFIRKNGSRYELLPKGLWFGQKGAWGRKVFQLGL